MGIEYMHITVPKVLSAQDAPHYQYAFSLVLEAVFSGWEFYSPTIDMPGYYVVLLARQT